MPCCRLLRKLSRRCRNRCSCPTCNQTNSEFQVRPKTLPVVAVTKVTARLPAEARGRHTCNREQRGTQSSQHSVISCEVLFRVDPWVWTTSGGWGGLQTTYPKSHTNDSSSRLQRHIPCSSGSVSSATCHNSVHYSFYRVLRTPNSLFCVEHWSSNLLIGYNAETPSTALGSTQNARHSTNTTRDMTLQRPLSSPLSLSLSLCPSLSLW